MVFFVYEKKTAVPVLAYEALVTKEYNIFMEHDFWHKIQIYNFDPYNGSCYKYTCAT